jgi:DmsE family decaheme c-type cytochrome
MLLARHSTWTSSMPNNSSYWAWVVAAGIGMLVSSIPILGQQPTQSPEASKAAAPAQPEPAKPAEYVGSETCKACHEEIFNNLQKTPHSAIESGSQPSLTGKGWKGRSCESCHGPGSKHADSASPDDIKNPAKEKPGEVDRTCLNCHLNQNTPVGRLATGHAKDEVGCTTCHSIHGEGGAKLVTRNRAEINANCASCHISAWAAFNRPYRHKLPEGAMSCVDCHNPHASFKFDTVRTSFGNEPGCLQCHSDKRGPFVYEHPVVRMEGCTACHEPHGSANPRMLIRHEVRLVCLECHSNLPISAPAGKTTVIGGVPPAFHDLRTPQFQNCTICHVKVHGSYVDRNFLR